MLQFILLYNVLPLQVIQDWHMFLLMGILLGIDILFLIIITSIPQAILTVELVELPLIVSWVCVAFMQMASYFLLDIIMKVYK